TAACQVRSNTSVASTSAEAIISTLDCATAFCSALIALVFFSGEATHLAIGYPCPASRRTSGQFGATPRLLALRAAKPLRQPLSPERISAPSATDATAEDRL